MRGLVCKGLDLQLTYRWVYIYPWMYTNVRRNVAGLDISNIKQTQIKGLCVPQTAHDDPD